MIREIVLRKSEFEIIDGMLYHVEKNKRLRIVPPSQDGRESFLNQPMQECLGDILGVSYMANWPNITGGQACNRISLKLQDLCFTSSNPCTINTYSCILVASLFDREDIDVIKLPTSSKETSMQSY